MKLYVVPTVEGPLKALIYTDNLIYPCALVNPDMFYEIKAAWAELQAGRKVVLEVKLADE